MAFVDARGRNIGGKRKEGRKEKVKARLPFLLELLATPRCEALIASRSAWDLAQHGHQPRHCPEYANCCHVIVKTAYGWVFLAGLKHMEVLGESSEACQRPVGEWMGVGMMCSPTSPMTSNPKNIAYSVTLMDLPCWASIRENSNSTLALTLGS